MIYESSMPDWRIQYMQLGKNYPFYSLSDDSKAPCCKSDSSSNIKEKGDECCVLISSWDNYSDLWKPFFTLFWNYWTDCPFQVFLTANAKSPDDRRIQVLGFDKELSWSSGLKECLQKIQSCYVLLMLEDFFLRSPVRTADALYVLEVVKRQHAHMARLIPNPGPDSYMNGSQLVGTVKPGRDYRVNLQAAIWRRTSLLNILRDGESPWEFEINGTKRCETVPSGFLSVRKPVLTYRHHVVEKGKWFRNEAQYFGALEIGCDFSVREVMSKKEMREWKRRKLIGKMLAMVKPFIKPILQPIRGRLRLY
jgi:hypothetical protein